MRRPGLLLGTLILLLPPLAWATGFGGDAPPSRIPIPARDFSARVVDNGGTEMVVDRVSYNGEVFLYGNIGAAQVTIPFEKITTVTFGPHEKEDTRTATATMKDGQSITVLVDDDILCYGKTKFGNYSIEVEELRTITFTGGPTK